MRELGLGRLGMSLPHHAWERSELLMQSLELIITLLPAGRESFHALYYKDGVHPSAIGTYLESCVMSSVISGREHTSAA